MLILAFDTCLDKTYIVLRDEEKVISSKIIESNENNYHSAYLISTIRDVLKDNGYSPKDIEAIGINVGPGSFTGIRACTTVARMIAQQLNLPAVGVSSLEILSKINPTDKPTMIALDARKNSAYLYCDEEVKGAIQLDEIKKQLEKADYYLITDDKMQKELGGTSYQQAEYPLGDILAKLAYEKLKNSSAKWQELKPLYIQPPPMG